MVIFVINQSYKTLTVCLEAGTKELKKWFKFQQVCAKQYSGSTKSLQTSACAQ